MQWIGENKREAGARAGQAQAGEGGERVGQEKKAMEKIPLCIIKNKWLDRNPEKAKMRRQQVGSGPFRIPQLEQRGREGSLFFH